MSLKEQMIQLKKEEELKQVKLAEGKEYKALISSAYIAPNQKGYKCVFFELKIVNDAELDGKSITKWFLIDETSPSKIGIHIHLKQLYDLLTSLNVDFETEKDLAIKLPTLIDTLVTVTVKYNENKVNPDRPWPNYTIRKA